VTKRPSARLVAWTRWLNKHPVIHGAGLTIVALAVTTGGGSDLGLVRIVVGLAIGAFYVVFMRKLVLPNAMRNIKRNEL
jgi:hypothetical protein